MEINEDEIIKDAIDGNKSTMGILFNMYANDAVKLAYFITSEWSTAEDAVQEAFIRAFSHIKSFDRNKKFKPWFTKIVVNEAKRAGKRSARHYCLEDVLDMKSDSDSLEYEVIGELSRQVLLEKINKLELKYRLPIILKYFSDLSEKEISQVLVIPVTTVKARLYKARQILKNDLTAMEVGFQYER
ncbi:RNA polymerase sigma factor [Candidatus Clostridium radicumherbarum]|uniref:RNA polymerase sigma factor n=1 Tax=Candidatus Clostridium radicumherbarum TaxID=3381662 RepID=A0ABW8TRV2_9CLOT